jgi:multidrug resistance efflux pump
MTNSNRIPIPLSQWLRRARYRAMPVITFMLAVVGTYMLWSRHTGLPNGFGAVEAMRHDVISPGDGWLIAEGNHALDLFEEVEAGQPIVRLDDRPARESLTTVKGELAVARKDIIALEAELKLADAQREQDRHYEIRRLTLDVEQIRLTILDHKTDLQAERINHQRLEEQVALAKRLFDRGAVTELDFVAKQNERDVAAERIKGYEALVKEAETQFAAAQERAGSLPPAAKADTEAALGPLRAKVLSREAMVRELEVQIREMVIRAPAAGQITAIYRRAGQAVRAGDLIVTIADPTARRIVAFVRPDQRINPVPGMPVTVRPRTSPSNMHRSQVSAVGAQVELVPPNQLRAHNIPEWGRPVSINLPPDVKISPGEVVDLIFNR